MDAEATDDQRQLEPQPPCSSEDGGKTKAWTITLPLIPRSTNQRAEITAIILALQQALERVGALNDNPRLDVKIYSDSKYVINCMTDWIYKWVDNGWINTKGNEVVNQDLLEEASDLDDRLKEEGKVKYIWIPREENVLADRLCNVNMDDQE